MAGQAGIHPGFIDRHTKAKGIAAFAEMSARAAYPALPQRRWRREPRNWSMEKLAISVLPRRRGWPASGAQAMA